MFKRENSFRLGKPLYHHASRKNLVTVKVHPVPNHTAHEMRKESLFPTISHIAAHPQPQLGCDNREALLYWEPL